MMFPELTWSDCILPDWRVSSRVRALITTRKGGTSLPPYGRWQKGLEQAGGLNIGLHTGDDPSCVNTNRARLIALTNVRAAWLEQVHGDHVVDASEVVAKADAGEKNVCADASVTTMPGIGCVVMTADCLPVLLCDEMGHAIGAAHAGWRGLASGVIEKTASRVAELAGVKMSSVHAFLGPAIGPNAFEVGEDVREAFISAADERDEVARCFVARADQRGPRVKYWADLYALARLRLNRVGIEHIGGGNACTMTNPEQFYSYRREPVTGRMAALIWLT